MAVGCFYSSISTDWEKFYYSRFQQLLEEKIFIISHNDNNDR